MGRTEGLSRIEKMLSQTLKELIQQIGAAIENETDPQQVVCKLQEISNHPSYQKYCDSLALNFTMKIEEKDKKTWREAAWKSSRGSEIYTAIMEELRSGRTGAVFDKKVRENARLITSLPQNLAEEFSKYIEAEAKRGRRSSEICKDLLGKYPEKSRVSVQLIARTETSKTQTALTQARAQELGLDWYVWRTSDDQKVRKSHEHMNGVLVRWSDAPSPELIIGRKSPGNYHAGDIYNCRCYPEPVARLDFLDFPMKVYYGGKIQSMTRAQFEKIA